MMSGDVVISLVKARNLRAKHIRLLFPPYEPSGGHCNLVVEYHIIIFFYFVPISGRTPMLHYYDRRYDALVSLPVYIIV